MTRIGCYNQRDGVAGCRCLHRMPHGHQAAGDPVFPGGCDQRLRMHVGLRVLGAKLGYVDIKPGDTGWGGLDREAQR